MEINVAQMAIFLGSAVILGGLATFGAYRTAKALIAMKKSGELNEVKKEIDEASIKYNDFIDEANTSQNTKPTK